MNNQSRMSSFKNAVNGILVFFKTQTNAKLHLAASVLVVLLGFYFQVSTTEWCLLIGAIGIVLIAEIFNSALELLSDVVSPDYDDSIKKIKDMAAGGVLIAACSSALLAAVVFLPKIMSCCF